MAFWTPCVTSCIACSLSFKLFFSSNILEMLKVYFLGLICGCFVCDGANILGIFYHPGRSHHKLGEVLLKAMAKRGHQVTMVSPYPLKEPFPNYTDIHLFETQDDMNAHPNIKLFITHGGLLSTIESVHHGVPMIEIPMFGDQNSNVPTGVNNGYALKINNDEISEESLLKNINEIINNPKYTQRAKLHSQLMRKPPIKPLDRATYWMEYVIKNKGAPILRNTSRDLAWYQYALIDVALVLFGVFVYFCHCLFCP